MYMSKHEGYIGYETSTKNKIKLHNINKCKFYLINQFSMIDFVFSTWTMLNSLF